MSSLNIIIDFQSFESCCRAVDNDTSSVKDCSCKLYIFKRREMKKPIIPWKSRTTIMLKGFNIY